MHPFLIYRKIGPFLYRISTYGVFVFLGLILTGFLFLMLTESGKKKIVANIIFLVIILGISGIGAKISQFLLDLYLKRGSGLNAWELFKQAGIIVTGGLVFALAGLFVFSRIDPHRVVTWQSIDAMAASFPLGHMLGRFGCFFGGCCYGKICTDPALQKWTVTYPKTWILNAIREDPIPFGPRYPAPLIEAAGLLIIGVVLIILLKKLKNRGQISAFYFLSYGILRFFQEFLRGDDEARGYIGPLVTGQWFSILFVIIGVVLLFMFFRRKKLGLAGPPFLPLNGKEPREKDAFED